MSYSTAYGGRNRCQWTREGSANAVEPDRPESRYSEPRGEDGDGLSNVVHFPRDWIGPREELVPLALPGRAEDFWGEGLGAAPDAAGEDAAEDPQATANSRRTRTIGRLPTVRFPGRVADLASRRVLATLGVAAVAIACSALTIARLGGTSSVHLTASATPGRHLARAAVTLPKTASRRRAPEQARRRPTTSGTGRRVVKPVRRHPSAPRIGSTRAPSVLTAVVVHHSQPAAPVSYTPPVAPVSSSPSVRPAPTYSRPPTAPVPQPAPRPAQQTSSPAHRTFGQGGMLGPGHGNGTG